MIYTANIRKKFLFDGWHKVLIVSTAGLIFLVWLNTHAWAVGGGDPIEPQDRALAERMVRVETRSTQCSGVLLTKHAVLTAGHCLRDKEGEQAKPSDLKLFLYSETHRQSRSTPKVVFHPDYEGNALRDLALVFLKDTPFTELESIDLSKNRGRAFLGVEIAKIVVFGFGLCGKDSMALRKVEMEAVVNFPRFPRNIALDPRKKAYICAGDSGGAIFLGPSGRMYKLGEESSSITYADKEKRMPTLHGIVGWTVDEFSEPDVCSTCSTALVYIKLAAFRDWIIETVATDRLIRDMQHALNVVGCKAGAVDGIWGSRSRAALRRFAKATGADDLISPNEAVLERIRASPNPRCGPS